MGSDQLRYCGETYVDASYANDPIINKELYLAERQKLYESQRAHLQKERRWVLAHLLVVLGELSALSKEETPHVSTEPPSLLSPPPFGRPSGRVRVQ